MSERSNDGQRAPDTPAATAALPAWDAADQRGMEVALQEAAQAAAEDEVPVGCAVVLDGQLVARAHNRTRALCDPTAHAELLALREAAQRLGLGRLVGATVYSTLEPCFMCAGALSHARVARVVFAARDPKFGACASLARVLSDERLNHRARVEEGLAAGASASLLREFFRNKRDKPSD